jgi:hypothetical protein
MIFHRSRARAIALLIPAVGLLVASVAMSASAAPGGPPGNNGTVKIDGVAFDDLPNNEPHPGCVFQIDFYGYEEGDLSATYSVVLHAPTKGGEIAAGSVDIGEDAAGGGTDLDGTVELDLAAALEASGVDPHPIQGYHVKLTVNAEGSQGADKKHKVFWIECAAEVEPTEEPTVEPTLTEREEEPEEETTVLPRRLSRTGPADSMVIATAGAGLLLLGLAFQAVPRRKEIVVRH